MAKLDFPNFQRYLSSFEFSKLFVEVLGWNVAPAEKTWQVDQAGGSNFSRRTVAELGGVVVIQIVIDSGWPDEAQRMRVWKHIAHSHAENLLIFTDRQSGASQSQWYWVKRDKHPETGKPRLTARRHEYFVGQPVDLFASKLQAMVVELSELDTAGRLPVLEAARRIQAALDVEKTTKKFFTAYQQQHLELLAHIQGIDNERDKRWYASVLLNRLMFVWFLQKKGFLNQANYDYLSTKLQVSQAGGKDRFFGEFLNALFFEAFAKPEADRSKEAHSLTGQIPYLNGGLFLHHKLELDADHAPRVGKTLMVADVAFEGIFNLFASFTWHLDDTPGGDSDEINPDVLGYIFEKYINQKAFGAYYTRPEITGYLAERSIHHLILERVYEPAVPELKLKEIKFDTVADLLARMDTRTALKLVNEVLPSITILDPAVGSGAFLVAALKTLINIYYAVVGRAELGASAELQDWLRAIQKDHPSVGYYIKRRIVTDNLHGVDIMEEACEIAKLRLFLAMVSSVRKVEDLEPLPNIDFNILPGNSLVGLMRVDEVDFNQKNTQLGLFAETKPRTFAELLKTKNRKLDTYRHSAEQFGKHQNLRELRDDIDAEMRDANGVMNELMRDQFEKLQVRFEQAVWDADKKQLGKPKKRAIEREDIDAQTPFHWGYVFDKIVQEKGGFDIILANPPWEVFKPQAKEFFAEYSDVFSKNKMTIKDFEKESAKLAQNSEVRAAWLAYESRFPHMSAWYRAAPEFRHQSAIVGGKKTGSDVNLYKLFVERSFHLLRPGGHCGIVIPNGLYKDMGATGLRNMLLNQTRIDSMVSLSNEKFIFEEVHHSFGLLFLTFTKGGATDTLHATFRINPREAIKAEQFTSFVEDAGNFLEISVGLIRSLSPETASVMEFKCQRDIEVAKKMLAFPALGTQVDGAWNLVLGNEMHMTNDSPLFQTAPGDGRLPLYEGKMIHQFESAKAAPRYWVNAAQGRAALLGRTADTGQTMPYQRYRLAYRAIARNTDSRTLIASMLPKDSFYGNSLSAAIAPTNELVHLYLLAILNAMVFDYGLRQMVAANLNMFFIYQCPVPRLDRSDAHFGLIVHRAARLTCTTPEFDDLAKTVGLKSHRDGATEPAERARLRAEIDGLVAHLYGLSEAEFAHILGTFPLVAEPTKIAALNAWRDVQKGLIS
jgi:hypothetical protein